MADQNLDTVRGAYQAFGRGDVPAVLAILADDIAWAVPPPLPQAGDAHGRDEGGAFFERLCALWGDPSLQLDGFVPPGDRRCVIGRGSGKGGGPPGGHGVGPA